MQWFRWKNHPFRLLLYLEWVLLGIAVVAAFSPHHLPPPPHHLHPPPHPPLFPGEDARFPLAAVICIVMLGLIGLRLPTGSHLLQILYTVVGFGLSGLAVVLNEQKESYFSPLLLVVVIRACLMFPWRGRLLVACSAYGLFLLLLLSSVGRVHPLEFPPGRLPAPPLAAPKTQDTLSDLAQNLVTGLTLNSALLFGLILIFVLLLVGSLLSERQSRQDLALANRHLRQYALLIEDQTILQERNRIAREIHDSLGHSLTAQSIQLEYAAMLLSKDVDQAGQRLQTARRLGKEALQNVRRSVSALRTHPLQGQSLAIALTKLLQEVERSIGIQVKTQITLSSLPLEEVATALYRITQEALTNISKHSNATQICLILAESKMGISLRLEDNGQGFDPDTNTTGFGLQGMRERAEAMGGSFCVTSQLGQGCQIQVDIPLSGRTYSSLQADEQRQP